MLARERPCAAAMAPDLVSEGWACAPLQAVHPSTPPGCAPLPAVHPSRLCTPPGCVHPSMCLPLALQDATGAAALLPGAEWRQGQYGTTRGLAALGLVYIDVMVAVPPLVSGAAGCHAREEGAT